MGFCNSFIHSSPTRADGLCWQIVPAAFFEMIADPDAAKAARVTSAMFGMTKFDIAALEKAYAGV